MNSCALTARRSTHTRSPMEYVAHIMTPAELSGSRRRVVPKNMVPEKIEPHAIALVPPPTRYPTTLFVNAPVAVRISDNPEKIWVIADKDYASIADIVFVRARDAGRVAEVINQYLEHDNRWIPYMYSVVQSENPGVVLAGVLLNLVSKAYEAGVIDADSVVLGSYALAEPVSPRPGSSADKNGHGVKEALRNGAFLGGGRLLVRVDKKLDKLYASRFSVLSIHARDDYIVVDATPILENLSVPGTGAQKQISSTSSPAPPTIEELSEILRMAHQKYFFPPVPAEHFSPPTGTVWNFASRVRLATCVLRLGKALHRRGAIDNDEYREYCSLIPASFIYPEHIVLLAARLVEVAAAAREGAVLSASVDVTLSSVSVEARSGDGYVELLAHDKSAGKSYKLLRLSVDRRFSPLAIARLVLSDKLPAVTGMYARTWGGGKHLLPVREHNGMLSSVSHVLADKTSSLPEALEAILSASNTATGMSAPIIITRNSPEYWYLVMNGYNITEIGSSARSSKPAGPGNGDIVVARVDQRPFSPFLVAPGKSQYAHVLEKLRAISAAIRLDHICLVGDNIVVAEHGLPLVIEPAKNMAPPVDAEAVLVTSSGTRKLRPGDTIEKAVVVNMVGAIRVEGVDLTVPVSLLSPYGDHIYYGVVPLKNKAAETLGVLLDNALIYSPTAITRTGLSHETS